MSYSRPVEGTRYFGYWRPREGRRMEPGDERLPWPADLIDEAWDPVERQLIADYLEVGTPFEYWMGHSGCRLCGKSDNGVKCLTADGSVIWPEGFGHYVREHSVRPPQELIDYLLGLDDDLVAELLYHDSNQEAIIAKWKPLYGGEGCPDKGTKCEYQKNGHPMCLKNHGTSYTQASGHCLWASNGVQEELKAERARHKAVLAPFIKVPWESI